MNQKVSGEFTGLSARARLGVVFGSLLLAACSASDRPNTATPTFAESSEPTATAEAIDSNFSSYAITGDLIDGGAVRGNLYHDCENPSYINDPSYTGYSSVGHIYTEGLGEPSPNESVIAGEVFSEPNKDGIREYDFAGRAVALGEGRFRIEPMVGAAVEIIDAQNPEASEAVTFFNETVELRFEAIPHEELEPGQYGIRSTITCLEPANASIA